MRELLRSASPALALAVWASAVFGQQELRQQVLFAAPLGGGDSTMLLQQESVKKELKLTPEQITKVKNLSEKMRVKFDQFLNARAEESGGKKIIVVDADDDEHSKRMQELRRETEQALARILKPEQAKRLKQISYQRQGSRAFTDPEVTKVLQLTDEQKKKIHEVNEETNEQLHEFFQPGMPPDEETHQKMTKLQRASVAKIMRLLTVAQKTKWKELEGKPFKGEIGFGPPGHDPE